MGPGSSGTVHLGRLCWDPSELQGSRASEGSCLPLGMTRMEAQSHGHGPLGLALQLGWPGLALRARPRQVDAIIPACFQHPGHCGGRCHAGRHSSVAGGRRLLVSRAPRGSCGRALIATHSDPGLLTSLSGQLPEQAQRPPLHQRRWGRRNVDVSDARRKDGRRPGHPWVTGGAERPLRAADSGGRVGRGALLAGG